MKKISLILIVLTAFLHSTISKAHDMNNRRALYNMIITSANEYFAPAMCEDFFKTPDCVKAALLLAQAQRYGGTLANVLVYDLDQTSSIASFRGTVRNTITNSDLYAIISPDICLHRFSTVQLIVFTAPYETPTRAQVMQCLINTQARQSNTIAHSSPMTPWSMSEAESLFNLEYTE